MHPQSAATYGQSSCGVALGRAFGMAHKALRGDWPCRHDLVCKTFHATHAERMERLRDFTDVFAQYLVLEWATGVWLRV